jgi:hypothetical protein
MNAPIETISLDEIDKLLKSAASRDQRSTDVADALAWWADLNRARVSYADAADALSHYYASVWPRQDPKFRFRATAPAVIEIVHEARRRRHEHANFVYEPCVGETGAQYVARLRSQLTAVGDGDPPLHSTAELRPRPVAALVAGIADAFALPPEIADILAPRRTGPRSVRCPVCSAAASEKCTTDAGRTMDSPHPSRIDAWAIDAADCPECHSPAGDGCRQMGQPYPNGAHPGRVKAAERALRAEANRS